MTTQGNLYTIGKCHFPKKTELHGQEVQYIRKEIALLNEKLICIYGFEFHSLVTRPNCRQFSSENYIQYFR